MSPTKFQIITTVPVRLFIEPCTYYPTREAAESQLARVAADGFTDLQVVEVTIDPLLFEVEVHYGKPE